MSKESDTSPMLEAAYRRYCDYVFRVCMKFAGGDRDWALDRVQDVFIKLNDSLGRLDVQAELAPWLRQVAVNECLMDLRRRERRRRLLGIFGFAGGDPPTPPDQEVGTQRDVAALDEALVLLPAKQRVLLALMYFDGASLTEAAALVGVSKGQASKLHKSALVTLGKQDWEGQR
jgi:RNA polymerase sigma-70 factor (ECF subfamily)